MPWTVYYFETKETQKKTAKNLTLLEFFRLLYTWDIMNETTILQNYRTNLHKHSSPQKYHTRSDLEINRNVRILTNCRAILTLYRVYQIIIWIGQVQSENCVFVSPEFIILAQYRSTERYQMFPFLSLFTHSVTR